MSIDGTYGRLGAHKQRMNDMRSKRREKKENNSRSTRFDSPELIEKKPIDQTKLAEFKQRFEKENKRNKRIDLILGISLFIGAIICSIFMIRWAIGL
jgi:hypothetical protein